MHASAPRPTRIFALVRSAKVNRLGFTLVELLVVISTIAILSVIGTVVFTGIQKSARDATRKTDIDAIAKAYEVKYASGYQEITNGNFASGIIPTDPRGNNYFRFVSANGFKTCASLDTSSNQICNTPSINCYCRFSQQDNLGTANSPLPNSGYGSDLIGVGGNSSGFCDNLMILSTYSSTAITGWSPQTATSHIAVTTDSRFAGNVLKFYSDSGGTPGDRVWASSGAQTTQFLQNFSYKISFNYTATANFALRSRDNTFVTVPANTGNARSYSFIFNNTFPGGCNLGYCMLLIGLTTPGMVVNIQNLSISTSCT